MNAPNVTLTFNLLVPGTYVVYMINKGLSSLVKTVRKKEYEVPDRYSDSVWAVLFNVNPEE